MRDAMPQVEQANGAMTAVVLSHSSRDGFLKKPGTDETLRFVKALSATSTACLIVCSQNGTRACIASRFAPGKLRVAPVVDGHLEVVTIGQTKTCGRDRAETWNVARYPRLTTPRSAAVAAGTVEQVPGTGAHIRPGDAHVTTTRPGGNGREAVFDALRGERYILACRVAGAVIARFHEVDALRAVISLIDRRIVEQVDAIIA